ncbi:histone H3.v1 [Oryzias melastigma]|uniref:histone H3.v1 n=1 Tax=Oryzias melastigma TaxID=30732 RepID=UPI000CF813FF|nr:histone H3.v1 [Oryzias melastigma]
MSSEPQEDSVREQLSAAEETFRLCEGTIVQNENEELCGQRRLLDITWNPQLQLHRIVIPQHYVSEEDNLYNQQKNLRVEQEEPEFLQIKEEQEEPEFLQIKEEREEPESLWIKREPKEPEPPQIKEEPEEPEPPQVPKLDSSSPVLTAELRTEVRSQSSISTGSLLKSTQRDKPLPSPRSLPPAPLGGPRSVPSSAERPSLSSVSLVFPGVYCVCCEQGGGGKG